MYAKKKVNTHKKKENIGYFVILLIGGQQHGLCSNSLL